MIPLLNDKMISAPGVVQLMNMATNLNRMIILMVWQIDLNSMFFYIRHVFDKLVDIMAQLQYFKITNKLTNIYAKTIIVYLASACIKIPALSQFSDEPIIQTTSL